MADSAPRPPVAGNALPIAAVEHEVGIGKDRLRVWERRYGFPLPLRDASGDRLYPPAQVVKLKLIKRLIDCGHAPRRVLPLDETALSRLLGPDPGSWHADADIHAAVELLRRGDLRNLDAWLRNALLREGLERFVLGDGRALVDAVGHAWEAGALAIWQEHYFSARFSTLLGAALGNLAFESGRPRILLATPSGERHGLGLLMARALFAARGTECVPLGQDVPNAEIVACAIDCEIDVVALSISIGYSPSRARDVLSELRGSLPAKIKLWVGGAAVGTLARSRGLRDITLCRTLQDGLTALES